MYLTFPVPLSLVLDYSSKFNPSALDGLKLWLDASDGATYTATNNRLSQWADKSGEANNVTSNSLGPLVNTRTLNGKPTVYFDGTDAMSTGSQLLNLSTSDFSSFTVLSLDVHAADVPWSFGNVFKIFDHSSAQYRINASGGGISDTVIGDAGSSDFPRILTLAGGGIDGECNTYLDGVLDAVNTGSTFPSGGTDYIIGAQLRGHVGSRITGYIAEHIVYNRKLTNDEITQVHLYLANKWGVAQSYSGSIVVSGAGQSNMSRKFIDAQQGELAIEGELDNFWATASIINGATSGSAAIQANGSEDNYWLADDFINFGAAYYTWETSVSGQSISLIIDNQGESDAPDLTSVGLPGSTTSSEKEGYKTAKIKIYEKMRSVVGDVPILIEPIGRRVTDLGNEGWQYVREVQRELAQEYDWIFLAPETYDHEMLDNLHRTYAEYSIEGARTGRKAAWLLGRGVSGGLDGPTITTVSRTGTTVTVTIAHDAGTNFTPVSAIEGFVFKDSGTDITITSAVRTNATTITLTLNSVPSGVEELYYAENTMSGVNVANVVIDNSTESLPLRSTVFRDSGSGFTKIN